MTSEAPILDAYYDQKFNSYEVWCQYCEVWHSHGAEEGHRSAHCADYSRSPYQEKGYILRYAGKWTPAIRKLYKPANARRKRQIEKLALQKYKAIGAYHD